MYSPKFLELIAKICDKNLYKEMILLTWDAAKYFFGYSRFFKKFKRKDIAIIRYTDWKKRSFKEKGTLEKLAQIHIPKSWHDLENVENSNLDFIANRHTTKTLKQNEEIVGMVLKTWSGERTRYYPTQIGAPEIITKFNAIVILGGDSLYIIYDIDWLQGIEAVTPDTEEMTFFKRLKWFF